MSDVWHGCVLFQAKFYIYEVIRATESAVKSRVNSIPSHRHILAAIQLGEINALVSAEAKTKGKPPGSPAKTGALGQ